MFTEHEQDKKMNRTTSEREIAETALKNLEGHTGIKGTWEPTIARPDPGFDGKTSLSIKGKPLTFITEIKGEFRGYFIDELLHQAKKNKPFLLIAEKIFPAQKQRLREEGIAYLDVAGNIYVADGETLIWLEGQKAVRIDKEQTKRNRAFTKAGLRIVYIFLENETYVNYTYRQIASLATVALGTIKPVISALKEDGYLLEVNKKRMLLNNKKQLLENWLIGYANVLKPSLLLGTYFFREIDQWKELDLPEGAVWGGEPAGEYLTNYLNPQQWTIYTSQNKVELIRKLQLIPKEDGNLKIYKRFFAPTFQGCQRLEAPEIITYADLMITGDPRCIETAQILYENRLAKKFD
ncbi:type IV toxin-antitoxin system AbiEi family antitoxin [Dyadobacter pollutisoli]|uniref:Type IV toxin-antitoxin system AbiEi family antitoxin n=2 Tax=Dyadobacter pollutisoli TaxID=2910158 RepID=A0A9E8NAX9_9BACT|nr:type IV toxin-antitoxin system AbiEi family antitoxin [Dyadobacter pollutisoli]WAC13270.1 type IV toxin-antitoxin system AbiEi family antitoxin [Dyadobacter pollutisoli]